MSQSAFRLEDCSSQFPFKLWTVTFDLQGEKVNKFSEPVIQDFEALIAELEKKGSQIDVIVLK